MKTLSFDLNVPLFKIKMIVKTNEMKGMIMMSQQDLPTLFYSGKSNSAVQLYLKVNYKQLQLNHGLKFPKRIAIRRIEL